MSCNRQKNNRVEISSSKDLFKEEVVAAADAEAELTYKKKIKHEMR